MKTVITLDDEKFGGNYYHAAHVEPKIPMNYTQVTQ